MTTTDLPSRVSTRLDPSSGEPVAHQIVEHVWVEVIDGTLRTGERLPTVRELAIHLGVGPRTIEWAYRELERLGVTATRPGEGTFVSLSPPPDEIRRKRQQFLALCREAVEGAESLGYSLDDLIEALAEFRSAEHDEASGAGSP